MSTVINPFILFTLVVLGGAGVCLALPRGGKSPQVLGAMAAGLVGGLLLLFMGINAKAHLPNVYFYVFSLIGLGSALRVVTHPRPVYSALYFVLTVIASAGLFVILSAEFMAFALIIVYAGAILITYLFVIMLATQSPEEGEIEVLAAYDTNSREPFAACVIGFLLLAVMSPLLFGGVTQLGAPKTHQESVLLSDMPTKAQQVFAQNGLLKDGESVSKVDGAAGIVEIAGGGAVRQVAKADWPADLRVTNIEALGFNLLRDHPGTIEIAGVILLMAMLGAVVLSRKQVQIDEDAKLRQSQRLAGLSQEGSNP